MPSGGARVRSGPPRNPSAVRHGRGGDGPGTIHLPASGRAGETPRWPLSRPTRFELETWESEWRRPQAIMWERLGLELQVALYVRTMRGATGAGAGATRTTALLRQIDGLGLSVAGLRANGWIIDEPAAATTPAPRRPASSSAKDRLAVIRGGMDAQAS